MNQAEAAEPVPDAQEEHEGHEAHELPVAQGLEAAIETPALSEEELDLSALEALPVVDFSDLLGTRLMASQHLKANPHPTAASNQQWLRPRSWALNRGRAQSQDDLTKDAQGDLSLEGRASNPGPVRGSSRGSTLRAIARCHTNSHSRPAACS